jgi:hypothetical protein
MRCRIEAACIFHNLICHNAVRQCAHSHGNVNAHRPNLYAFVDTRAPVCMQNKAGEIGGEREAGEANWPTDSRSLSLTHSLARVQWPATHRSQTISEQWQRLKLCAPLSSSLGICARNFRLIAAKRREKIAYLSCFYCHVLRVAVSASRARMDN